MCRHPLPIPRGFPESHWAPLSHDMPATLRTAPTLHLHVPVSGAGTCCIEALGVGVGCTDGQEAGQRGRVPISECPGDVYLAMAGRVAIEDRDSPQTSLQSAERRHSDSGVHSHLILGGYQVVLRKSRRPL